MEARVLTLGIASTLRHLTADHDPNLVTDADAHGDTVLRIETRLAMARLARGQRGLALAEEAVALLDGVSLDLRYRALAVRHELLTDIATSDLPRFARATEAVRTAARDLKSPWAELDADNSFACAQSFTGDLPAAIALFEDIAKRASVLRFGSLERQALTNIATCHMRGGNARGAADTSLKVVDLARGAGDWMVVASAQTVRSGALLELNELEPAKAAADEAVKLSIAAELEYQATVTLLRRADIRARLGDVGASEDATLAQTRAEQSGDLDMAFRATLWLLLRDVHAGVADGLDKLRHAVTSADHNATTLRAPTKRMLETARQLLAAHIKPE